MIDIFVEIAPDYHRVVEEVKDAIDERVHEWMQYVAADAPGEMQLLMSDNPPSSPGEAPAKRSKELFNSLQGKLTSENTVEIQMAEHAFYLDPIFEGEGSGGEGGYLNRPFIETGIQKAFDKL